MMKVTMNRSTPCGASPSQCGKKRNDGAAQFKISVLHIISRVFYVFFACLNQAQMLNALPADPLSYFSFQYTIGSRAFKEMGAKLTVVYDTTAQLKLFVLTASAFFCFADFCSVLPASFHNTPRTQLPARQQPWASKPTNTTNPRDQD